MADMDWLKIAIRRMHPNYKPGCECNPCKAATKVFAAVRRAERGFENCAAAALYAPDKDPGELVDALDATRATANRCLTRLRSGDVGEKP